ncbi:kinase-like domain-containing protein [Hypoxylon trugodes]|uniref:kinase-like domain-containing protein n=1 Tax=Hypoxylon trugodes TaxID=326681 RepID=UPI0021968650|nr:kinase-like domain-containing protein [Hypoxylon trugodes]KAI1390340.1 kinase-like domain-containing protein [Hypoxylon trugodes]
MNRRTLRSSRKPSLQSQAYLIRSFFESDLKQRFYLEKFHAKGGQGGVYKVKYVSSSVKASNQRLLVLKIADPQRGSDVEGLRREAIILKGLRYCRHIVTIFTSPNDPLKPARESYGWAWAFLEHIENDTLTTFMVRAKEKGLKVLPNRLLWSIFFCMIRAYIAMAWPVKNYKDLETAKAIDPSGLAHNDIHGDNLLFGSYMRGREHGLSPILKLLDFGLADLSEEDSHARQHPTGEQSNILDIGIMMASVIGLQTDRKYSGEEMEVDLSELGRADDVLSPAAGILEDFDNGTPDPYPLVDKDLRLVLAACLAVDYRDRPTLEELERWAGAKILNTDPNQYAHINRGREQETDERIHAIVQACIFDA